MNYEVFRLLSPEEAIRIVCGLGQQTFVDGKSTAMGRAREVKHNLQVERADTGLSELDNLIVAAFTRSKSFQDFAMPQRFAMPVFSRYEPGMEYGPHIDNSLMGGFNGIRTDFAMTIFLSSPSSYDGGELVIHLPAGREEIKLDCGEAIVYSASYVHHVAPVTRGVRLAAISWVQSVIRDERLRAILYDLSGALQRAEAGRNDDLSLQLTKSYHNLVRYAAEP
jgi:PKHD-type hydroxylase